MLTRLAKQASSLKLLAVHVLAGPLRTICHPLEALRHLWAGDLHGRICAVLYQ